MKNIKQKLVSLTGKGPNSKIFFLTLKEATDNEFKFLAGIFDPNKACQIKHARVDRLIKELEHSIINTSICYTELNAPNIDTTSIAFGILNRVGITTSSYDVLELTAGYYSGEYSGNYVTGFRFSIPREGDKPAPVEITGLLTWTERNLPSFKQQEEKYGAKEDIDKINFERFVLEEKWEKEKQLAEV